MLSLTMSNSSTQTLDPSSCLKDTTPAVQGVDLTDEELLSYISESSTMSKSIEEYEGAVTILPSPLLIPSLINPIT